MVRRVEGTILEYSRGAYVEGSGRSTQERVEWGGGGGGGYQSSHSGREGSDRVHRL